MTDQDEKLSCLLDDFSGVAVESAINEVIGDVNLQYRMRRYQMIGEAVRHELPDVIDTEFHSKVMAGIGEQIAEPSRKSINKLSPSVSSSVLSSMNLKPLAGLAVATSVAVVTIALWQPASRPDGRQDDLPASTSEQQNFQQLANQSVQGAAVPASTRIAASGMRWKINKANPGLQQKLNAYLVSHIEYSNSMQGLIPQVRVAGFDRLQ